MGEGVSPWRFERYRTHHRWVAYTQTTCLDSVGGRADIASAVAAARAHFHRCAPETMGAAQTPLPSRRCRTNVLRVPEVVLRGCRARCWKSSRRVLTTYSGPRVDDGEVSRALRAIATDAQAQGVRAEQLLASLKQVFDSLAPPDTLASLNDRAHRLSYLVTTCVREYYAVYPGPSGADAGPTR